MLKGIYQRFGINLNDSEITQFRVFSSLRLGEIGQTLKVFLSI